MMAPYMVAGVDVVPDERRMMMTRTPSSGSDLALLRCTMMHSSTTFLLCCKFTPHVGYNRFWVERVPADAPLPPDTACAGSAAGSGVLGDAAYVARSRTRSARLPRLPPKSCAQCGAVAPTMKLCGGCQQVAFCGLKCLRAYWHAGHKRECANMAAEANAAAAADTLG